MSLARRPQVDQGGQPTLDPRGELLPKCYQRRAEGERGLRQHCHQGAMRTVPR